MRKTSADTAARFIRSYHRRPKSTSSRDAVAVEQPTRNTEPVEPTTHQREVEKLRVEGCAIAGFKKAILTAVAGPHTSHTPVVEAGESYIECDRCDVAEDMGEGKIVPDAFVINVDRMEVTAHEVEVTCPVSAWKLEKYINWFWAIDQFEWLLRLVIVDRFGNRNEVDLLAQDLGPDTVVSIEDIRDRLGIRRPGEATP